MKKHGLVVQKQNEINLYTQDKNDGEQNKPAAVTDEEGGQTFESSGHFRGCGTGE
jgi:hypothetical protein